MKKNILFPVLVSALSSVSLIHADTWVVEAKCAVPIIRIDGTEEAIYVWGRGRGKTEYQACKNAKDDVDRTKPDGTGQKKHCRCLNGFVQKNIIIPELKGLSSHE